MWAPIAAILDKVVGTLPQAVIDYYKNKRELEHELKLTKIQAKIDLAKARSDRQTAEQRHTHTWESMYVRMQQTSYKDEIVLSVFLWPFVGVFIPVVQDYVLTGFEYLEKVPYWWTGITVAISLAIYGIRHRNASRISAPGLRKEDVIAEQETVK